MRAFIIAAIILFAGDFAGKAYAQVNFGVSVGDRNGFYLELGNYYGIPQRDVMVIHDRRIDDDDLPVVFFMAHAAGVPPVVVADLRRDGWSWREIAFHFRLDPAVFYVPAYGVPYSYGRWHSYRDWRRSEWRDEDFVRFANVRFISEHYRWDPADVMRMRAERRNFYMIHNDIYYQRMHEHGRPEFHGDNGHHNGWDHHYNGWDHHYNRDNGRDDHREMPHNNDSRPRRNGRERE